MWRFLLKLSHSKLRPLSSSYMQSINSFNIFYHLITFESSTGRSGSALGKVRIVLYFGPEKCLKESRITWGVASKRQVWSTFFLFEIFDHVSKGKFGPYLNCSKRQVWSRFGEKSGPNLPFENISLTWFKLFKKGKFGPIFSPNLDQTCLFEQFECGPNLPFDTWS